MSVTEITIEVSPGGEVSARRDDGAVGPGGGGKFGRVGAPQPPRRPPGGGGGPPRPPTARSARAGGSSSTVSTPN